MNVIDYLRIIVLISVFYSFAITTLSYTLPDKPKYILTSFESYSNVYNVQNITRKFEQTYQAQTSIPLADMAALVFYSGNIFIDLLFNFIFAIPSMLTLLLDVILRLLNVPAFLASLIKLTVYSISFIFYIIMLISALLGIRTGRLSIT